MRSTRSDWATFLALGLAWGSSYLFIKLAVNDFGTFTLVALRLGIGAALLWTVLWRARQPLPRSRRTYGHLFVMGLINITLPFFLITWAEQHTESSLAAVLTSLVPLFTVVLAPIFIHDEPLRVNAIVGLAVGFIGVLVLTSRELGGATFDLLADLALVGAALCYGAGAVYARRNVRGLAPMVPAVFQVSFAFLVSGVVALGLEHPWDARPSAVAMGSIVWLGLVGSGFAYLAFFRLLSRWGATRTTLVAYVLPVVGIALGAIVLSEPVDARLVIGTALVIAGVALVNSRYGRRLVYTRARQDAPA
ncbi:MAG TPA: DMT family transporter [Candidatus Limnocylindrales bacterium]|nr:DMT family transporter [Candidatus Limnocylindrales bacterium]